MRSSRGVRAGAASKSAPLITGGSQFQVERLTLEIDDLEAGALEPAMQLADVPALLLSNRLLLTGAESRHDSRDESSESPAGLPPIQANEGRAELLLEPRSLLDEGGEDCMRCLPKPGPAGSDAEALSRARRGLAGLSGGVSRFQSSPGATGRFFSRYWPDFRSYS